MEIYLVGGAVRDKLLNYPVVERDWVVVGATAEDMLKLGYKPVGKDFPVFLHPDTHEEYALARTERKTGHGYTGFSCHTARDVSLEEDLLRRDLTINAMAEDCHGNLIDPYGGMDDIRNKKIRHVSPAFCEDPLRILRVARFAARYAHLGFQIAHETMKLMQEMVNADEASYLVPERIWKEFDRALLERQPQIFLQTLNQCSALSVISPELNSLFTHPQLSTATKLSPLDGLQEAARKQLNAPQRLAVLCHTFTENEPGSVTIPALCQNLRIPKTYQQLASYTARYIPVYARLLNTDSQLIFKLLDQAGVLQKRTLLGDFMGICEAIFPNTKFTSKANNFLQTAREKITAIKSANLINQGYSGKALGNALKQQRIKLIEKLLQDYHD